MKDINEIINTLVETAKKYNMSYTNTAIKDTSGDFNIFLDIRIEKERPNPYGLINTIPQPFKTEENIKE